MTNQSQLIVSTPQWLQRRMLKNLVLAASNRGKSTKAKRASEILVAMMKGAMR
jgi:hypothetical protein